MTHINFTQHALRRLAFVCFIYSSSHLAWGQTPSKEPNNDVADLEQVVVVGKRLDQKDKTYQQAGTEYFINKEDIERFRGMSTGDFVKSIPGVLTGDNRNSGAIDLNIRGMQGMNRVPVVIDGSLQSTTVYRGYSGVASRNYLDPDLITSVAIEKGPTSGADGVGAIGGVARMRTLSAKDIIPAGEDWGIQLKGSFLTNTSSVPATGTIGGFQTSFISACSDDFDIPVGDGGGKPTGKVVKCQGSDGNLSDDIKRPSVFKPSGGSGSIAVAKKWHNIDFMMAYAQREQGNYHAGKKGATPQVVSTSNKRYYYTDGRWLELTNAEFDSDSLNRFRAGEAVLNTSNKNKSLLYKSNINLPGDQSLELGYMKYKSDFGELMPSLVLRGEGAYQAQLSKVEVDTYTLRHRWLPNEIEWIDLKTDIWRTKTNTSIQNYYRFAMYGLFSDPLLIIHPEGFWETSVREGINLSNHSDFSPEGWGNIRLDYGVSLGRERIKPYGDVGKKGTEAGGWALVNRDGKRKEWSGFLSAEYEPTSWLSLASSLRYINVENKDNSQYFVDDQCLRVNPRTGSCSSWSKKWADRDAQKHHATTPIASITFKPNDYVQLYARYAEAARAPSLFEETKGFSFVPVYDLKLKVERARNWEFGVNFSQDGLWQAKDKARLKLAYFNNQTKDYLTRYTPRTGGVYMNNLDSVNFKGWELAGGYDAGAYYVNGSLSYYTDTEVCRYAEDTPANAQRCYPGGVASSYVQGHIPPKSEVMLNLGARFMDEKLDVGMRMSHIGRRAASLDSKESGNGLLPIPNWRSYTLYDVYADYKLNKQMSWNITVDNATDQYYMDTLSLALMPSPGRTIRAGFQMNF